MVEAGVSFSGDGRRLRRRLCFLLFYAPLPADAAFDCRLFFLLFFDHTPTSCSYSFVSFPVRQSSVRSEMRCTRLGSARVERIT